MADRIDTEYSPVNAERATPPSSAAIIRRPFRSPLLVFTAILVPITFLPYLLTRRQLTRLSGTVTDLRALTMNIHHDQRFNMSETVRSLGSQVSQSLARYDSMESELRQLRIQTDLLSRTRSQTDDVVARVKAFEKQTRYICHSLQDVGTSLADIAAFIHEVEVRQGYPTEKGRRGVQRMQNVALRLKEWPPQAM